MDRILTLENGTVVEDGTYDDLVVNQGPFSRLMKEFGGAAEEEEEEEKEAEAEAIEGIDFKMEKKREGLTRMMSAQEVVEVDVEREEKTRQQESEEAEVARKVEVSASLFRYLEEETLADPTALFQLRGNSSSRRSGRRERSSPPFTRPSPKLVTEPF